MSLSAQGPGWDPETGHPRRWLILAALGLGRQTRGQAAAAPDPATDVAPEPATSPTPALTS